MNPPDPRQCTKVMLARVRCTKTNRPLSAQTPFQFKTLQRKNGQFPDFFGGNGAKTTPIDAMNVPERPHLCGGSTFQGQKDGRGYKPVGGLMFRSGVGAKPARTAARMAKSSASAETTA